LCVQARRGVVPASAHYNHCHVIFATLIHGEFLRRRKNRKKYDGCNRANRHLRGLKKAIHAKFCSGGITALENAVRVGEKGITRVQVSFSAGEWSVGNCAE
jgi:hypothetical protein